jgi:hypothetical protein
MSVANLLPTTDWNTDMWQTPDEIASLMAQLILPTENDC